MLYKEAFLQEASARQLQRQAAVGFRPSAAAQRLLVALARRRPLRGEPRPLGGLAPPRLPWERVQAGSGPPPVRPPVVLELLQELLGGSGSRRLCLLALALGQRQAHLQGGLAILVALGRRLLREEAGLVLVGSAPRLVLPIAGLGQRPPRTQVVLGQQTRVGLGLRHRWVARHPMGLARVGSGQMPRQVEEVVVLAALAALVLAARRLQRRVGLARRALARQRLLRGVGGSGKRVLGRRQVGLSGNTARCMGQNSRLLTSPHRQTFVDGQFGRAFAACCTL